MPLIVPRVLIRAKKQMHNFKVISVTPIELSADRSGDLRSHRSGAGAENGERCTEGADGHQNGRDCRKNIAQHVELSFLSPWRDARRISI